MKQHLLFFLVFFTATTATAQFKTVAYQDTITLRYDSYYVGNQKHGYGFMYRNLGNELKANPEADRLFRKSKRSYGYALLSASIGAAMGIVAMHGNIDNPNIQTGLLVGGLPFTGLGVHYIFKSQKQLKQAVYIRNQH